MFGYLVLKREFGGICFFKFWFLDMRCLFYEIMTLVYGNDSEF